MGSRADEENRARAYNEQRRIRRMKREAQDAELAGNPQSLRELLDAWDPIIRYLAERNERENEDETEGVWKNV